MHSQKRWEEDGSKDSLHANRIPRTEDRLEHHPAPPPAPLGRIPKSISHILNTDQNNVPSVQTDRTRRAAAPVIQYDIMGMQGRNDEPTSESRSISSTIVRPTVERTKSCIVLLPLPSAVSAPLRFSEEPFRFPNNRALPGSHCALVWTGFENRKGSE